MSKEPVKTSRFGPPPSEADTRGNILASTPSPEGGDKNRFINFRVTSDRFIEIKTAALHQGLSLGDYLILTHEAYIHKKRL